MRCFFLLARLCRGARPARSGDGFRAGGAARPPKRFWLGVLHVVVASCLWPACAFSAEGPAWLNISQDGSLVQVEALCGGLDGENVHYELVMRKAGPSGQARSVQAGDAFVAAGEEKALARSATRLGLNDMLRIELRVFAHGRALAGVAAQVEGRPAP